MEEPTPSKNIAFKAKTKKFIPKIEKAPVVACVEPEFSFFTFTSFDAARSPEWPSKDQGP